MDYLPLVKTVLSEVLEIPKLDIKPECSLTRDLGADSLDLEEVAMKLEDNIADLELPNYTMKTLVTVEELVEHLSLYA